MIAIQASWGSSLLNYNLQPTTYHSGVIYLYLRSLFALLVQGLVSYFTQEAPELVDKYSPYFSRFLIHAVLPLKLFLPTK